MTTKKTGISDEEKKILDAILNPPKKDKQPAAEPPPLPKPIENLVKIDVSRCVPSRCHQECASACPINTRIVMGVRDGTPCMQLGADGKMKIDRETCSNCRSCEKYCPMRAIYFH